MKVSKLPGSVVLQSMRKEIRHIQPPVLIFLLCPNISDETLSELCRCARQIDRMTDHFVIIILFWSEPRKRAPSAGSDDNESTARLLDGRLSTEDFLSLRHGFVDEAYAVAHSLGIPYAKLPCIVVFDDLGSSEFYQFSFVGVEHFVGFATRLTDFLRKQFAPYFETRAELLAAIENLGHIDSNSNRKRLQLAVNAAARQPEIRKILERAVERLMELGQETLLARNSLAYIMTNPRERSAQAKLLQVDEYGLEPELKEFNEVVQREAEKLTFGATVETLKDKTRVLERRLSELSHPVLKDFVTKERLRYSLRRVGELLGTANKPAKTALDVVGKAATAVKAIHGIP
jgi:hypothetical protein